MKQQHPIRINQGRKGLAAGGRWEKLDPLAKGRVQILLCHDEMQQAQTLVQELQRLQQLDNSLDGSQCAVLTTEWRLLNPVRACLEAQEIPFSLALPKPSQPSPFRIRENLTLLNAIKQSVQSLGKASDWLNFLNNNHTGQQNIWLKQLKQLLQQWQEETDNAEISQQQLLEYLYESLAEQRRDSRLGQGVYLSTIHSVKGLEFNHVFILDGGWSTPATEEQRRLSYVAMTRAKETLCLLQRQDLRNPFLPALDGDFVLRRDSSIEKTCSILMPNKRYAILGLKDFDLSYAGSFPEKHPIHQALANLNAGSMVTIGNQNGKIVVRNENVTVAILSKNAQQQWLSQLDYVQSAKIVAMITRYKTDSGEEYQSRCKVEQWEVPMVEVVLMDENNTSV